MVLKYLNPMHTTSTEEMFRVRERLLMYVMLNSKSVSHARLIQTIWKENLAVNNKAHGTILVLVPCKD